MGNCSARPRVQEQSVEDGAHYPPVASRPARTRRSSLGRFAELLSPQSSAIRDAVSEKLPTAANRGSQEVIALVEGPGYLEPAVWCAGLDVPVVKARATALEKAIDTLLTPVTNALEELLGGKAAEMGKGQSCYWHTASLKEVLFLLPTAARMHNGVGLTSLSHAFGSMVIVVHALSQAALDAELPVPPEIFHVGSLNRLLDIVGTVAGRQIAPETAEAGQKRWQDWEAIQRALCLEEEKLLVTLGARSKVLLLWMQGSTAGRRVVSFQVRRETAFTDAFQQAQASELLQTTIGACAITASFVDTTVASGNVLEPGIGHGPLKDFMLLAGQGMLEQPEGEPQLLEAGTARRRRQPLFLYNRWAARFWFNTRLAQTAELQAQYSFAGWLLGQCLGSRTSLGVAFPELLFSKLLLGPNFKATLEVLQEFDVEAAAAVRGAAAVRDSEWRQLLAQEGLDPMLKRKAYIRHAVHQLLVADVEWQFLAFAQGFFTAVDFKSLLRWSLTPADLEDLVAWAPRGGAPHTNMKSSSNSLQRIQDAYRVVMDPAMQVSSPLLGPAVLKVVNGWPLDMKLRFLKFVTGASRPCQPGMEVLRISMPFVTDTLEDWPRVLAMLPQAHTCENILELPDYSAALLASQQAPQATENAARSLPLDMEAELQSLLQQRLSVAVHCSTFDLVGGPSTGLPDVVQPQRQATPGAKASARPSAVAEIAADATHRSQALPRAMPRQRIGADPGARPAGQQSTQHSVRGRSDGRPKERPPPAALYALAKPEPRAVTCTKHALAHTDGKIRPEQSGSPLSPDDSIPALRHMQR